MTRQLYLLLLVFTAVLVVESTATIEVDKNGDEYEVKSFNIPGRQLKEGRSQCVLVRRKRATVPQPMYSNINLNDEVEYEDNAEVPISQYYSPPIIIPTAAEEAEDEEEVEGSDMSEMNQLKEEEEQEGELTSNIEESNKNESEENKEVDAEEPKDEDNKEKGDVDAAMMMPHLPILGQLQNDEEFVAAFPAQNETDTNAIVVVQSHVPPKVNPQTHVVFQLIPVYEEENKNKENETDLNFKEESAPITMITIFSTGGADYKDYDSEPMGVKRIVKKSHKPLKAGQQIPKPSSKPKHKNKYNSYRKVMTEVNKKRRPNTPSSHHRRHGSEKDGNSLEFNQNNSKNKVIVKRKRNKKRTDINKLTASMTMKQPVDDKDYKKYVNCIIIHKETPTTKAPSFWNIFRRVHSSPRASGEFGKRKRANVRFVA